MLQPWEERNRALPKTHLGIASQSRPRGFLLQDHIREEEETGCRAKPQLPGPPVSPAHPGTV